MERVKGIEPSYSAWKAVRAGSLGSPMLLPATVLPADFAAFIEILLQPAIPSHDATGLDFCVLGVCSVVIGQHSLQMGCSQ